MSDRIVLDTTERILADLCPPEVVNDAENGVWPAALWEALEESGLTLAWVGEELGGGGAEVGDGFDILKAAGAWAVPGAARGNAARGLASGAGGPRRAGRCDDRRTGRPCGRQSSLPAACFPARRGRCRSPAMPRHIALLASGRILLVEQVVLHAGAGNQPRRRGAGRHRVRRCPAAAHGSRTPDGLDRDRLALIGAAVRSAQMAGALSRLLDQSVQYAQEREQFGRPIGRFQAVQHALAELAGEAAAAEAAADAAGEAVAAGDFGPAGIAAIAAAKVRAGEAASKGAAIAHQVHGAMGFTYEHSLHHRTRRLWCWRDEFGNERVWSVRLGRLIAAQGADGLWPFVTGSRAP